MKTLMRKQATWCWLAALFVANLAFCRTAQAAIQCTSCAFVTDGNSVYAWDPIANTMTTVATFALGSGQQIDSLVFDTSGNIIVDVDGANDIYRYNIATQSTQRIAHNIGNNLGDLTLEPAGNSILIASRNSNQI